MRVAVDSDEFYPVYFLTDDRTPLVDGHVELTPEERADFDRVWKEWSDWQDRLQGLLEARKP